MKSKKSIEILRELSKWVENNRQKMKENTNDNSHSGY